MVIYLVIKQEGDFDKKPKEMQLEKFYYKLILIIALLIKVNCCTPFLWKLAFTSRTSTFFLFICFLEEMGKGIFLDFFVTLTLSTLYR